MAKYTGLFSNVKCANFMNQSAIRETLNRKNKEMGEILYNPENNKCIVCDYGLGLYFLETNEIMIQFRKTVGPFERVCYKELQQSKVRV